MGIPDAVDGKELAKAFGQIRRLARSSSPDALSDLGVAYLAKGELERSEAELERAAALSPTSARIANDLAVVLLARAPELGFSSVVKALSAANRAVQLAPALPEARFNRALALEALALRSDALHAWEDDLAVDSQSEWSHEARAHRQRLASPAGAALWERRRALLLASLDKGYQAGVRRIVASQPQEARRVAEEELLPAWSRLRSAGQLEEADASLDKARLLGSSLAEVTGDRVVEGAVAAIAHAEAEPAPSQRLASLMKGHREYSQGLAARAADVDSAPALFARSRRDLARGDSPFADWAAFQMAVCALQRPSNGSEVEQLLRPIAERPSFHPILSARARWVMGLDRVQHGDLAGALFDYRLALDLFHQGKEEPNAAVIESLTAEAFRYLGEHDRSAVHMLRSLAAFHEVVEPRRAEEILAEAAIHAAAQGEPALAMRFQSEVIETLRRAGDKLALVAALEERAAAATGQGDLRQARADLDSANQVIDEIQDKKIRRTLMGEQLGFAGRIERGSNPRSAVEKLGSAIHIYAKDRRSLLLPSLRLELAQAQETLGDDDAARGEIEKSLRDVERQLSRISDQTLRAAYMDEERELFNEMVVLEVKRGSAERGFAALERARAAERRSSNALWRGAPSEEEIPEDVVLVAYSLIADRILIWTIDRQGVEVTPAPVSATEVQTAVDRMRVALLPGGVDDEVKAASEALYRDLVQPVARHLQTARWLEFLPDRQLAEVPFAALRDHRSQLYLIQRYSVGLASSAASYLASLQRGRDLAGGENTGALVVGNPSPSKDLLPWLPALANAEEEARRVAALYSRVSLLIGREATKRAFLAELGDYPVVHFAGHSLHNQKDTLRSALVLAPGRDDADSGILTVDEIQHADLSRVRLVVLSACATAASRSRTDFLGLAGAFLEAGVPAVVASLWEVDDRGAAELISAFHRRVRAGDDAQTALRRVQLERLGSRPVREWAAFALFGGEHSEASSAR